MMRTLRRVLGRGIVLSWRPAPCCESADLMCGRTGSQAGRASRCARADIGTDRIRKHMISAWRSIDAVLFPSRLAVLRTLLAAFLAFNALTRLVLAAYNG